MQIEMLRLIVFWSDHEIKMQQNIVFRLNQEIQKSFKNTQQD